MSRRKTQKPYAAMTAEELARATRGFDKPMPGRPGKPLTPAQKTLHRKARKAGRPKVGRGAATVAVSIERGLLKEADALARRRKVGRSQLFVAALRAELKRAKAG